MLSAVESPVIQQLRGALPDIDAFRERDAAARKALAEDTVARILEAIDDGDWPLSDWELYCLSSAIFAIRTGYYSLAYVDALLALEPSAKRSTRPHTPAIEVFERSVPSLRRELAKASALPVRARHMEA